MAEILRKPPWLRVQPFSGKNFQHVAGLLADLGLHTVCQEANCPNRGECFNRRTAVFLILGSRCTRHCRFCNVTTGKPEAVDPEEPAKVAEASARLKLRHVVVTSVTRDDLPDGGAEQFARTIREIRNRLPNSTIEVLTPDFLGSRDALAIVLDERPHIFNHNVETVPRLYPTVRPQAQYLRSLEVLQRASVAQKSTVKSGIMVGLGETGEELIQLFHDLAESGVSILTVGQYLAPSPRHIPIERFVTPEEFEILAQLARAEGISVVLSGPLVRSSYLADTVVPL